MDKKGYLVTILTKLESKWDLARGLRFFVEQGNLDDNVLDIIIQSIEGAIDTIKYDRNFVELKKAIK